MTSTVLPSNLRIAYRHLDPSPALSETIAQEYADLAHLCSTPLGCHVTVARSDRFGTPACEVSVHLDVGGTPLVANRTPEREEEADPYAETREAFRIARRLLVRHLDAISPRSGDRIADHLPRS